MNYARIEQGLVAEVIEPHPDGFGIEQRFPAEFVAACMPVPDHLASMLKPGWRLADGEFQPPETVPAPVASVPEVTARQLRLWLLSKGVGDATVRANIALLPEGEQDAALIEWEFSTTYRRDHPLVGAIGEALDMTPEAIDQGFRQAAGL